MLIVKILIEKTLKMIINPNSYKSTLDTLKPSILRTNFEEDPKLALLTLLSVGSHVPFIVLLYYAMRTDVIGPNPILKTLFDSTKDFYKYTAILPWNDL